jgi:tellurite resistance protein TerC
VYLKAGVAFILVFVGAKMVVSAWVHVPILLSLAVIIGSLVTAIGLSLRKTTRPAGA